MEAAKEDIRSDISVLKRAADKTDTESMKAQIEKKRQVFGYSYHSYQCFSNINI